MTSLLHKYAVAICLTLLLAACQPIESVPPVEVLPTATSLPTSAPSLAASAAPVANPTSTGAAPTLIEHIVLDEGYSLAIPEGWASIELDNRRLEENIKALESQDATRAEYENDLGRDLIDHSISFYAYELANQIEGSPRAEILVTATQLSQDDIEAFVTQLESAEGIILPVGVRTIHTRGGLEMTEISYSLQPEEGDAFKRAELRRYILEGENMDFLISVVAFVTDEEEPFVPFDVIAESFALIRDGRDLPQQGAPLVIITNGLITDTSPGGKTVYTSTRDGFAVTLPDSWVETPLRNAESISQVLFEFAESSDGLGWPETSPYYLDIEALAVFQGVKLFWIDSDGPNPQGYLTTIRASTSPLGRNESLQTIVEAVAKGVVEDEDEQLISLEQMQTPAGTVVEIQLDHTNTYLEDNPKNRTLMYYLISGPTLYTLKFEGRAEGAEAYIPILREIAVSLTPLEQAGQESGPIVLPTIAPAATELPPPTIVPTATQSSPEPTSVPATSAGETRFDGEWAGKTSQGQPINFKIQDNAIVEFWVEFEPAVCGSGMMSDFESTPLTENAFEKAFTFGATRLLLITGSVDGSGTMNGAITAEKTLLCEPTILQWSATR